MSLSRRRLLTLPALALMQSWPDRANQKPEPMTLEELTLKMQVQGGINEILSKMIGGHTRQIRHLYWLIGGETYPPAKGEL